MKNKIKAAFLALALAVTAGCGNTAADAEIKIPILDSSSAGSYKTAAAEAGVTSNYMGENVASGHITPQEVVQDWMDSEGHRANILNPRFTRLGVGLTENTGNSYSGYAWVQIFSK